MSKKQWAEPQAGWIPLKNAVFKLAVTEQGSACDLHQPFRGLAEDQLSLTVLREILKQKSGAKKTKIDVSTCSFCFHFGEGWIDAMPWEILEKMPAFHFPGHSVTTTMPPPFYAKFEEYTPAIWAATSLVWGDLMLAAFNRAVGKGAIALYARPRITSLVYERLPAQAWPLLKVVDWENGMAMALDHASFWSVHAERETAAPVHLKPAPRASIDESISAAYDRADALGQKPPNIKELAADVLPLLEAKGYWASRSLIMQVGSEPKHARRRRGRGQKLRSQQRAPMR